MVNPYYFKWIDFDPLENGNGKFYLEKNEKKPSTNFRYKFSVY